MSWPVEIYGSRITLALGVLLLVDGTASAQSLPQVSIEQRTDRPGKDYKSFDAASPDARKCKEPCARDTSCKAYTFVKAGVQGRLARCYLKSGVPEEADRRSPQAGDAQCHRQRQALRYSDKTAATLQRRIITDKRIQSLWTAKWRT